MASLVPLVLIIFTNCTNNPSNNRTQLTIVPDPIINHLSNTYYFQFLQENRISKDKELNDKIREIGKRIEETIREKLVHAFPMLSMFLSDEMVEKVTNLFRSELKDFLSELNNLNYS